MTPDLLAKLGLPATWRPEPAVWAIASLEPLGAPTGQTTYVLILDSAAGRNAFAFTDAELRALADKAAEVTTGLTVARTFPANGARPGS